MPVKKTWINPIPDADLATLRQECASELKNVDYDTHQADNAYNAVEEWWDVTGRDLAAAEIEAIEPGVFDKTQTDCQIKHWMHNKFERGG